MLPMVSGIHKVVVLIELVEILFYCVEKKEITVVIENIFGEHRKLNSSAIVF